MPKSRLKLDGAHKYAHAHSVEFADSVSVYLIIRPLRFHKLSRNQRHYDATINITNIYKLDSNKALIREIYTSSK